jgi:hypothetical protein
MREKNFSMKLTTDDAKKINGIKLFHGVVKAGDDWLAGWPKEWEDVAREALLAVRDGEMDYAMKLIARLQSKIE